MLLLCIVCAVPFEYANHELSSTGLDVLVGVGDGVSTGADFEMVGFEDFSWLSMTKVTGPSFSIESSAQNRQKVRKRKRKVRQI